MFNRTILSAAVSLAAGMFATSAMADGGDKHGMDDQKHGQNVSFEKIDTDGDGYISQSEFQNANLPDVDHEMLDSDGNGDIDQTEFAAFEQLTEDETGTQYDASQSATDQSESAWPTDSTQEGEYEDDQDY